jgi:hypothetical protein
MKEVIMSNIKFKKFNGPQFNGVMNLTPVWSQLSKDRPSKTEIGFTENDFSDEEKTFIKTTQATLGVDERLWITTQPSWRSDRGEAYITNGEDTPLCENRYFSYEKLNAVLPKRAELILKSIAQYLGVKACEGSGKEFYNQALSNGSSILQLFCFQPSQGEDKEC